MRPQQHKVCVTCSASLKPLFHVKTNLSYIYPLTCTGRCWIPGRTCIYGWSPHYQMVVARFIRCWEEQMLLLHAFVFIELLYKSMSTISFYPNRSIHLCLQAKTCQLHSINSLFLREELHVTSMFITINNLISGFVFSIHCHL